MRACPPRRLPTRPWVQAVVGRSAQVLIVTGAVTLIVFALLHLDPARPGEAIEQAAQLSSAEQASAREALGLQHPLPVQFLLVIGGLLRGDLGTSLSLGLPVSAVVGPALAATVELIAAALLIGTLIGVPLGVIAALRPDSRAERICRAIILLTRSVPSFCLILFIQLLATHLGWLSVEGQLPAGSRLLSTGSAVHEVVEGRPADALTAVGMLLLAAAALGPAIAAALAQVLRDGLIAIRSQGFSDALRIRGASRRQTAGHQMRSALPATTSMLGHRAGFLLGGVILVEVITARPGVGRLIVDAMGAGDFPLVQGAILATALVFVLFSLGIDILLGLLDPRVRTLAGGRSE